MTRRVSALLTTFALVVVGLFPQARADDVAWVRVPVTAHDLIVGDFWVDGGHLYELLAYHDSTDGLTHVAVAAYRRTPVAEFFAVTLDEAALSTSHGATQAHLVGEIPGLGSIELHLYFDWVALQFDVACDSPFWAWVFVSTTGRLVAEIDPGYAGQIAGDRIHASGCRTYGEDVTGVWLTSPVYPIDG